MISRSTYLAQRPRRFGRSNPERMDFEHWIDMVRGGETAYHADRRHLGEDAVLAFEKPGWCFDRFGMTRTRLPDGSVVCVAGEHEDHYDPDFCIYNDVIVISPRGDVAIYGYPPDVFPPTDFHTATLIDGRILVIGSLGYGGNRVYGTTPVYCLDLATFRIDPLATTGDAPGWISRHVARLGPDRSAIRISDGKVITRPGDKESYADNERGYRLDLRTLRWSAADDVAEMPLPGIEWPEEWKRLETAEDRRMLVDAIARAVAPDHPLFAADFTALGRSLGVVLLRSCAAPDVFIACEHPDYLGRQAKPLRFESFQGIDAWRSAATGRGAWWWSEG